ncbi:MAG: hypothetical protein ABFC12_05190 [Methanobacterium sp.]
MLTKILGECSQVKLVDFLVAHPWSEYTKKDLAEASGISRSTLYHLMDKLETYHINKARTQDRQCPSFTHLTRNQIQPGP